MKLKDAFRGRENNLGLMRLVAALAVILSHSFVLAAGQPDPVSAVTGGQATFGQLAVLPFCRPQRSDHPAGQEDREAVRKGMTRG